MRALALICALLVASCTSAPPDVTLPAPTAEPRVLDVTALLDLSGDRHPSGAAQRNALAIWTDVRSARPGATRVRLKVVDVGGSDARVLLEIRRAAVEDRADALVIGVPFAYDDTQARALELANMPVLLTLPAPEPAQRRGGRSVFALAPTAQQLAARVIEDARARGTVPPAVLVGNGTVVANAERMALRAELERLALAPVMTADITERDREPQTVLRPIVTRALAVLFAGATREGAAAIRATRSIAPAATLYLSYLTDNSDMSELAGAAANALWPGSRHVHATGAASVGPAARTRAEFLRMYGDRHGSTTTHAASAYDAMDLLAFAADRVGGDDRERLRELLEQTTFAGIATTYTFSPSRHSGFASEDLTFLTWTGSAPAIARDPRDRH